MKTDERFKAFGKALAEAIARSERSQFAIAKAAGISDSALSNWKTGEVKPHPDDVRAVEDSMGLEPGTLLVYLGYVPAGAAIPSMDWESALLSDPEVDPDLREHILSVVRLWRKRFG